MSYKSKYSETILEDNEHLSLRIMCDHDEEDNMPTIHLHIKENEYSEAEYQHIGLNENSSIKLRDWLIEYTKQYYGKNK